MWGHGEDTAICTPSPGNQPCPHLRPVPALGTGGPVVEAPQVVLFVTQPEQTHAGVFLSKHTVRVLGSKQSVQSRDG